jgi:Nineteen complex-related protein 2
VPKNKSKLRISFDPTEIGGQIHDEQLSSPSNVTGLKRPHTTIRSTLSQSILGNGARILNSENDLSRDRPTYNKDYLNELRNSTPSTPKELSAYNSSAEEDGDATALDIDRKFGQSSISSSVIPSAAEIQEKKERRARLAKEQGADDFIALEDYDSDGEFKPQRLQVSKFLERDRARDTRLVHDDEDIAEGFDEFVEDSGRVTLSKKGKREQERKARNMWREMIEEAEDTSDEDDSEAERNDAYVAAQTSHGMDGLLRQQDKVPAKPKPPKEFAPIPKLSTVLTRLRGNVQALEFERARLEKRKLDIQKEKLEVVARQDHIQLLLTEAGKRFEELGNEVQRVTGSNLDGVANDNGNLTERGLESLTNTPSS